MPTPEATWPKTVDDAVYVLSLLLEETEKENIKKIIEEDLIGLHFGLGMYIRNNFGLLAGNKELLMSCGSDDPDDASMFIIKALWKKLKKEK